MLIAIPTAEDNSFNTDQGIPNTSNEDNLTNYILKMGQI